VLGLAKAGMTPFVPRVTLSFPALASTHEMLFLIDSADKRGILQRVLVGRDLADKDLPAHRAYADGDLVWLVVRAAAPEK
jgi:6-phosphogluconolactonase